jgi:hypothetical protein
MLFEESGWNKYRLVSTIDGVDPIVVDIFVDNPEKICLKN